MLNQINNKQKPLPARNFKIGNSKLILFTCVNFLCCLCFTAYAKTYKIDQYNVEVKVTPKGHYQVHEKIVFDFTGDVFSYAYRNLPLEKIDRIYDIDIESPQTSIKSIEKKGNGNELKLRWRFASRTEPASFVLKYKVAGALFQRDKKNLVDWNAIGTDWKVPIRNAEVIVSLPATFRLKQSDISYKPNDASLYRGKNKYGWHIAFVKDVVSPANGFRVIVSFPKRVKGQSYNNLAHWMNSKAVGLALVLLPLSVCLILLANKMYKLTSEPKIEPDTTCRTLPALTLTQTGVLLFGEEPQALRSLVAAIFNLAKTEHLVIFLSKQRVRFFKRKEISLQIINKSSDNLNRLEQRLLSIFEKNPQLRKFGKDKKLKKELLDTEKRELCQQGYLKDYRLSYCIATWIEPISIMAIIINFVFLIHSFLNSVSNMTGYGLITLSLIFIPLFLYGVCVRKPFVCTEAGVKARNDAQWAIANLRNDMERLKTENPERVVALFAQNLPWLLLDEYVEPSWIYSLSKQLKDQQVNVVPPYWIRVDSEMNRELEGNHTFLEFYLYSEAVKCSFVDIQPTAFATLCWAGYGGVVGGGCSGGGGFGGGAGGGGGGAG